MERGPIVVRSGNWIIKKRVHHTLPKKRVLHDENGLIGKLGGGGGGGTRKVSLRRASPYKRVPCVKLKIVLQTVHKDASPFKLSLKRG